MLAFLTGAIALLFAWGYYRLATPGYLNFSDGAKFALVAKNLGRNLGFSSDFTFYSPTILNDYGGGPFRAGGIPALVPNVMALFFKLFGVNDFSVILFSGTFYILLAIFTYLLAEKLFGKLTGVLSALAVAANPSMLDYATSGASEVLYMFLAVVSAYLLTFKTKLANVAFFASLALLYFTKPQGVVFIISLLLCWFLSRFEWRRGFVYFFLLMAGVFLIDKFILYPLSFKYPVYPIVTRGIQAIFQYSPTTAVSDALRGQAAGVIDLASVAKKTFYNLYNFYKLIPQIMSPYLLALFTIGLFTWGNNKSKNLFKILTILVVVGSLLLTALTIPFYRYIHPVVPFIYVVAVGTLSELFSRSKSAVPIAIALVLFFAVGQTAGIMLLDSRFQKNTHNFGKPPVYVRLSEILRENTNKDQVIITNLDTWGSWYGERKTVWFPLEPKQLIDSRSGKIPFDAIYLTSYLIDDENYFMGNGWRQIFENPRDSTKWICEGCAEIIKEFNLKGVYQATADEDYERQDLKAMLLVRK
jgi:4-amino-4-deoxy-L-arabinose transferase-like glycosyltransferase